jgi:N-acetylneuraminic acid mutarotase
VVDGKIYVVGGNNGTTPLAHTYVYDPATDSWTAKAPYPGNVGMPFTGVVNGIIYVAGGQGPNGAVATVEAYDPATDAWTAKASMPTARDAGAGAVVGGRLYTVGGTHTGSDFLATVEVYDAATNTWTPDTPMPTPRVNFAAASVKGVLYALGGRNQPENRLATNEAFTPGPGVWTGLGATNNWSDGGNWQNGSAPNPGDALLFPSGASQSANNNDFPDGTSFSSLTFTGAGYDISGGAITLTSGMTANPAAAGPIRSRTTSPWRRIRRSPSMPAPP